MTVPMTAVMAQMKLTVSYNTLYLYVILPGACGDGQFECGRCIFYF